MKIIYTFFLSIIFVFLPFGAAKAQDSNQFVTIVNPVRISSYLTDPKESIASQYLEISRRKLPATWLLSFDALENSGILSVVRSMDKNQDFGILLEVSYSFAESATVSYNNTGSWHHANSVFLSGYTQDERLKLIDTAFEKFKDKFGYYPTSVGSWWTDSFSLSYIKEKYGITANLTCSDQFSTDGYKIWGQYWSTPFYPSRYHAGIPAPDESVKLDLVTVQWASRDPLNGYYSSLFSTQDYLVAGKGLDTDYFEKLVRLYAFKHNNEFGQIVIGLEADLGAGVYKGEYSRQLDVVNKLAKEESVKVLTMGDFANWYRERFPRLSPPQEIISDDLLGTKTKVVWYQSPNYRISYEIGEDGIKIRDLRYYNSQLQEPYYLSPNMDFNLSIYVPAFFDQINFQEDVKELPSKKEIVTLPDRIEIDGEDFSFELDLIPREGKIFRGLSAEAIHFLKQKRAIFHLLAGKGWSYLKMVNYLIPQEEMHALNFLSSLPRGKVMVYDGECLQCEYHTLFKPPSIANLRGYVRKYSKHSIISNSSVFKAKTQKEAKIEFDKLGVEYVYLVRFEGYSENLPFSPGDLGVEKIFENANAQVWRVE